MLPHLKTDHESRKRPAKLWFELILKGKVVSGSLIVLYGRESQRTDHPLGGVETKMRRCSSGQYLGAALDRFFGFPDSFYNAARTGGPGGRR